MLYTVHCKLKTVCTANPRTCGDPTLLSVYLQFAARLLCVSGAGVRAGAEGGGERREEPRVAEEEGGV